MSGPTTLVHPRLLTSLLASPLPRAFVAPQSVRAVLREHIGEEAATVGHLRLVPLPVVYNAMAERPPLRKTPLVSW